MYYVTPDWNPQSDSLGRGTMRFADRYPLGERGLFWLSNLQTLMDMTKAHLKICNCG